jgi:DNA-binding IclR family transcriptional regulator
MPSFNFDIGESERVGSRFLSDVRDELQRALSIEKSERKITQQQIAEKLGTSRAVINRQLMGLENMGIKRVAEILWAIGWEPHFRARKIPAGENQNPAVEIRAAAPVVNTTISTTSGTVRLTQPRPQVAV